MQPLLSQHRLIFDTEALWGLNSVEMPRCCPHDACQLLQEIERIQCYKQLAFLLAEGF